MWTLVVWIVTYLFSCLTSIALDTIESAQGFSFTVGRQIFWLNEQEMILSLSKVGFPDKSSAASKFILYILLGLELTHIDFMT